MEAPVLSQKDYLRKYFSKKDKTKKKKLKLSSSTFLKRSQIIDDDDLNLNNVASINDEDIDLSYLGDEAPQIVAIIDERAKLEAEKAWKAVEPQPDEDSASKILTEAKVININFAPKKEIQTIPVDKLLKKNIRRESPSRKKKKKETNSDGDISPPRSAESENGGKKSKNHIVEKAKKKDSKHIHSGDESPPRKNDRKYSHKVENKRVHDSDSSPRRPDKKVERRKRDSHRKDERVPHGDLSPPRNSRKENKKYPDHKERKNYESDQSPSRKFDRKDKRRDHDLKSYVQKVKKNYDSDQPFSKKIDRKINKRNYDSDHSPPRKIDKKGNRVNYDSDQSSPRKIDKKGNRANYDSDQSPLRKIDKKGNRANYDSDQSPPRKPDKKGNRANYDSDQSPPRKIDKKGNRVNYGANPSPPKRRKEDRQKSETRRKERNRESSDMSPPRNKNKENQEGHRSNKANKTLDGKKAGLQEAKHLKEELQSLRMREEQMFKRMETDESGQGNRVVMRDRRTGKIRDVQEESKLSKKKAAKQAEREAKYAKWGRGLKQVQDAEGRLMENMHEMSKPLARYENDEDLDNFLKAQEREGDPMLDYIRSRQVESHSLEKPKRQYEGSYAPNRFNIRPGHRWDGVDRSSGYEKKWFEQINARKAIQEEAYKWSSADL